MLNNKKVSELKKMAKDLGIKRYNKLRKSELVKLIESQNKNNKENVEMNNNKIEELNAKIKELKEENSRLKKLLQANTTNRAGKKKLTLSSSLIYVKEKGGQWRSDKQLIWMKNHAHSNNIAKLWNINMQKDEFLFAFAVKEHKYIYICNEIGIKAIYKDKKLIWEPTTKANYKKYDIKKYNEITVDGYKVTVNVGERIITGKIKKGEKNVAFKWDVLEDKITAVGTGNRDSRHIKDIIIAWKHVIDKDTQEISYDEAPEISNDDEAALYNC